MVHSKGKPFDPALLARTVPARATSALDWFLEALERFRAGDLEQASESCEEVLQRQGSHFWARYVLALCRLRTGRWVEARATLTVFVSRRPEFVWSRLLRGFAASELGFTHADKRQAAGEFRAAQKDFDRALKQDRASLVQYVALVNRGVLFIRQQRWGKALVDLQRAVQVAPEQFQAYANLAQALQGEGKGEQAVAALDQTIKRAPIAELYRSWARLQLLRKRRARARADFEQAIAREPKGSSSDQLVNNLVELGRLPHRESKYPAALASYARASADHCRPMARNASAWPSAPVRSGAGNRSSAYRTAGR